MDPLDLARGLLREAVDGRLPARDVLPALRKTLGEGTSAGSADLLEAFREDPLLAPRLRKARRLDVLRLRDLRAAGETAPPGLLGDLPADAPAGWEKETDPRPLIGKAMALLEDWRVVASRREKAPTLAARIDAALKDAAAAAVGAAKELPATDLAALFSKAAGLEEKRGILDVAATWPTDATAAALDAMAREPWAAERAALILALRLGPEVPEEPGPFRLWLEARAKRGEQTRRRPEGFPILEAIAAGDVEAAARIEAILPPPTTALEHVLSRWRKDVAPLERAALLGLQFKPPPAVPAASIPPAPPPPRAPSVWDAHVRPLVAANWTLAAGVAMVLVGATLLGYYTWDKHWLLRYTIMPALFAAFTAALAGVGRWMERRDATLGDAAATLRGAAIALLPVNFMAVALLARDTEVTAPLAAVLVMSALYLGLAGWGLWRWCGPALGGTLLALDALVMIGPLAETIVGPAAPPVVVGFYAGFAALAWALRRESKRFAFAGATLGLTFVQVFAWVHGYLGRFPDPHAYAPLVALAGGLVLDLERRRPRAGAESFLGFAFILLGILMGAGEATSRVVTLLLAGLVWLPSGRRHPAHVWIGLSLLVLGVASVALLPGFPPVLIPALGLAAAAGLMAVRHPAARGLEPAILGLTAVAAAWAQWAFQTPPIAAAGWMAAAAAALIARRQVFAGAAVLAAALPFAGCVDVAGGTLRGNTMTLGLAGLAWAWIAAARVPAVREARSAILWLHGALAIGAGLAGSRDLAGPPLMAAALVAGAIWSRSLVPGAMAALLLAVLAPAMKAQLQALLPQLSWGSGLGSAIASLALAVAAFPLRRLSFAGEGDRFRGAPFPFRRDDHALITWPLLGAAVFLAFKVDVWNVARAIGPDGLPVRTAIAVFLTGATWMLVSAWTRRGEVAYLGAVCLVGGIATGVDAHWSQIALASWLLLRSLGRLTPEPILRWGPVALAAALVAALAAGTGTILMIPLVMVMVAELVAARRPGWSVLVWAAVVEWLGNGWRGFPHDAFVPTIGVVLGTVFFRRERWAGAVLACGLIAWAPFEGPGRQALAAFAAMAAALSTRLGPLALGAAGIGWLALHGARPELLEPKSMAIFGAGLAALGVLLPEKMRNWVSWPGMALAGLAAAVHTAAFRGEAVQLWAPFLAAAAFALGRQWSVAAVCAALGNIHAVRLTVGPWLLQHGLSEIHLIAIGVAISTALAAAFRRKEALLGAAAVLALLAGNFLSHPDLREVSGWRFAVSGAMALLAAVVFRRGPLCHAGVTVALWCFALVPDVMRTPHAALAALALPTLWFLARGERMPATVTSFIVLAVYAAKPLFQLAVFPDVPFAWAAYHRGAPVVFVMALALLRLRALGATPWTAFYGGLALMLSGHFAVTALPGLSPFVHPAAGAWAAIAMTHFWTAASGGPSPLRAAIQKLSALDDLEWDRLRDLWGWCLAGSCAIAVGWGVAEGQALPLLIGLASVIVHQGILRRSTPWIAAGAGLAALALHADFVTPSVVPKAAVVWILLGLWGAALVARLPSIVGAIAAAAVFAHVLWHGPSTPSGLGAFAAGALLGAATPAPRWAAALLLAAPAWLAFFGAREWTGAALLATACALRLPFRLPARVPTERVARLILMGGASVFAWFAPPPLSLATQAGLAWAWWTEGIVAASEVAVLGAFIAARAQLTSMGVWRPDFDVWASLLAFAALAGAKPKDLSLRVTLVLLPLFTIAWVVWRGLGTDLLLITLGLQGVLFAAAGRDRRDSPWHGLSTACFVAFLLTLFWARLELRVASAYVIPVGLGVLALLRLFGTSIDPAARNVVRLATMLAMVGSAGYHALADDRYPIAFHLTMIALGLLSMGLGALTRIRVHVALGFAAVLVDLAAILVKGLAHMDRGARMTALGCGVLALGAALVAGAVMVKVRRADVDAALARLRLKLASWE